MSVKHLVTEIANCRLCADEFAASKTAHAPRPVVWFDAEARILIAGQAPGLRVHQSGKPFTDPSGDRLRDWLGLDEGVFYDRRKVAIVPMAFCFPGYNANNHDLPPPKRCAMTWRAPLLTALGNIRLTILVGGYAQKYHLGPAHKAGVTETVRNWRDLAPGVFALPHPSWRNTAWLKKNPWFDAELLPALRTAVRSQIDDPA